MPRLPRSGTEAAMSDQRTEGGWQALRGAPHGIPPICDACGRARDDGWRYEGGGLPLFLCAPCVAALTEAVLVGRETQP
jgi:hypothetical protein